jgi:beta-glucanase (GH16 family)
MKFRSVLKMVGIAAAASLMLGAAAQAPATAAPKNVYKLLWNQEFNGKKGSAPNPKWWEYDMGLGPNAEKQYYTQLRKNSATDGKGNLILTARLITETDPLYSYCMPDIVDNCWYSSARIKSSGLVGFKYGMMVARIKMPAGKGAWPAFWMLGDSINDGVSWPNSGELDIVEAKGEPNNQVFGTAHGPGYSAGSGVGDMFLSNAPLADEYHTYSIKWKPNRVEWYFDGKLYHTLTPNMLFGNEWVFNQEFFLILNLAMGGLFVGDIDPVNVTKSEMAVDYIRYYSWNGVGKVVKK